MTQQSFDLNTLWKETEAASEKDKSQFEKRPDGKYIAIIDDAEYKQSQSGNWGVNWMLRIRGESGREFKWSSLRPFPEYFADDVKWLKADLAVLDLECDDFDDLQSALDMSVGKSLWIEIKTVGAKQFRAIRFIEEVFGNNKEGDGKSNVTRDKFPAKKPDTPVQPDDEIPF